MTAPIVYVVGYLFRRNDSEVVLICKNKPAWQEGCYNGVGGKVESYDKSLAEAMSREFLEETGALVPALEWRHFAKAKGRGWVVYFFMAKRDVEVHSITPEPVRWVSILHDLPHMPVINNLKWLIPLALDQDKVVVEAEYVS